MVLERGPRYTPHLTKPSHRFSNDELKMNRYFEELLTDTRGKRNGFPLNILMELSTLDDYYKTKTRTATRDVWDT